MDRHARGPIPDHSMSDVPKLTFGHPLSVVENLPPEAIRTLSPTIRTECRKSVTLAARSRFRRHVWHTIIIGIYISPPREFRIMLPRQRSGRNPTRTRATTSIKLVEITGRLLAMLLIFTVEISVSEGFVRIILVAWGFD